MFDAPVKIRDLILIGLFSLIIILLLFILSFFDSATKIIFCDVGQGDATYIRIKNKIDVLIDAGPNNKILSCLGKYMPFWDRKIELAFLSHPNNDHYNGYFFITDRYRIDKFITVNSLFTNKTYKKLLDKISEKNIPLLSKISGDKVNVGNGQFIFYWPPLRFTSSNDNDFSQVLLFQENNFKILFTGDASPFVLNKLSHQVGIVNILKVPHHGSKNGLNKFFLQLADPQVAVISVSKNNSYGHPAKEVLEMLKAEKIIIRRTDVEGDIIFKIK